MDGACASHTVARPSTVYPAWLSTPSHEGGGRQGRRVGGVASCAVVVGADVSVALLRAALCGTCSVVGPRTTTSTCMLYSLNRYDARGHGCTQHADGSRLAWPGPPPPPPPRFRTVLTLKAMGINDLLGFGFMDPPPASTLIMAQELYNLGALHQEVRARGGGGQGGVCVGVPGGRRARGGGSQL